MADGEEIVVETPTRPVLLLERSEVVVTSVNGDSGDVEIDVDQASDEAVAAHVDDDASLTTAAVAARIAYATAANPHLLKTGIQAIGELGNSVALNGVLSYYDYATSGAITLGSLSYMATAIPKTNGRFRYAGVVGHVGYTSTQLLPYLPDLIAAGVAGGWTHVGLQVITNDPLNLPFATTKANIITMVDAILAAGMTPILYTAPPLGSAVGGNTGAPLTKLTQANLFARRLAAKLGLPLVDFHSVTVNPSDNNWLPGYSADGVHPTALGAKAMGDELARVLNTIPGRTPSQLAGSYNPNLMLPDAVITSAAADKFTYSGNTGGGWGLKASTGPFWKGNQLIINRGSLGDYGGIGPIAPGLWVPGNRVRVSFGIDVSACPTGGTWSANLYNFTQAQAVCGFSGMSNTLTNRSVSVTDCVTTTDANARIINSASGAWRPTHVGCAVQINSGVTTVLPAGTTIINVSMDGKQAYMSAPATVAASGLCATVSGEPCVAVFEFTVQPDMVGDTINVQATASGAAGTVVGLTQPTVQDITALGIAA